MDTPNQTDDPRTLTVNESPHSEPPYETASVTISSDSINAPLMQHDSLVEQAVERKIETADFEDEHGGALRRQGSSLSHVLTTPMRYIGKKVSPGSVKGSIFNLVIAIVGAGMLSLPYAIQKVGLGSGLIMLMISGYMTYFSAGSCLVLAASEVAIKNPETEKSYPELALLATGSPWAKLAMKCLLSLTLFGYVICYIFVISDIFQKVWTHFHTMPPFVANKLNIMLCIACLEYPVCLLRDLSALRFSSLFGLTCTLYITIVIVVEYFIKMKAGETSPLEWKHYFRTDPESWIGYITVLPICIFAYSCHTSILSIYDELKFPSQRRMLKVTGRGIAGCFTMYGLTGCFGFATFLDKTKDNILLNDFGGSIAIVIAQIALMIALAVSVPIYFNVMRIMFEINDFSLPVHMLISALIMGSAFGIACGVPNISFVFELIGSTTLPFICYIMPTTFLLKLMPKEHVPSWKKWLAIGATVIVSIISVINLLHKFKIING